MSPDEIKDEKKDKKNIKDRLRLIVRFMRGSKRYFIGSIAASAVTSLADMIIPQIIRAAVDNALGGAEPTQPAFVLRLVDRLGGFAYLGRHLWIMAAAILFVAVFKSVSQYLFRVWNTKGSESLVKSMRDSLFSHIERLPYAWHSRNKTGDIIQRCTSDIDTLKHFISEQLTNILRIVILVVFSLIFMLSMDPLLTAVAFLPMPLIIANSFHFSRKIGEGFEQCDEQEGKLSAMVQENLTGVRVVRAFGREKTELERFEKQNHFYTDLWIRLGGYMARFWTTSDILSGLQVMLVIVVGAVFCINGRMIAGEYLAFVTYNALLVWPVRMLGRMLSELSKAGVSTERIAYIMDSEEEFIDPDGLTPALDGDLTFDHVSFAYDGSPLMLQDISFTLPGGKTLGILGGTGSGKSTMIALLNKLYPLPADSGSIRIGGTDIRDIRTDYLRRNIGMVMQEPFLFSRSIRDNIAITTPGMSEEEVRSAARDACLDETVMGFAKGYDTFVGERGVTLSGGQKQRAAIARTLAQKPPILVFDDSLSAVDTETDAKIRAALARRYAGTTTILISHRITTLQRADLIIVLDKGRVAEMGTHEELLRLDGQYRQIYEIQSGLGKEDRYA